MAYPERTCVQGWLAAGWYTAAWGIGAIIMGMFLARKYREANITTISELNVIMIQRL